jgi:hypothetical protein
MFASAQPQMPSTKPHKDLAPHVVVKLSDGPYMEALAYSVSGKLEGPCRQSAPLLGDDSGHGMLFHTFDNKLCSAIYTCVGSCSAGSS